MKNIILTICFCLSLNATQVKEVNVEKAENITNVIAEHNKKLHLNEVIKNTVEEFDIQVSGEFEVEFHLN